MEDVRIRDSACADLRERRQFPGRVANAKTAELSAQCENLNIRSSSRVSLGYYSENDRDLLSSRFKTQQIQRELIRSLNSHHRELWSNSGIRISMCVSSLSAKRSKVCGARASLRFRVERYTVLFSSLRAVESLDRNPAFYTGDTGKDEGDHSTRNGGNL